MAKHLYISFIISFVALLFAQSVPRVMNYQGKLFYDDGPANGSYYFQYDLDDDTLSVPEYRWRQQPATDADSIVVDNGLFSDTLGLWVDTTLAAYSVLYLRVSVKKNFGDSWTYLGSERLWSAPYALVAANASVDNDWTINRTGDNRKIYTFDNADSVGIGTNLPTEKLDVAGNIELNSNQIMNVATPTTGVSTVGNAVSTNYLNGEPTSTSTNYKMYHDR